MQSKSHKTARSRRALTAVGLAAGLSVLGISAAQKTAHAQTASFPDVPANHWAYQAVQDLADKGYVKGYPDGKFLGKRALTRYEFATVIDRMAQTVADLSAQVKADQTAPVVTPTGTPVTQDDLNKINALADTFQKQLADIQSLTAGATSPFQGQLDALRSQILDLQKVDGESAVYRRQLLRRRRGPQVPDQRLCPGALLPDRQSKGLLPAGDRSRPTAPTTATTPRAATTKASRCAAPV